MDDQTDLVRSVYRLAKFFNHESCGQCTPCREGTNWAELILGKIVAGRGKPGDDELILRICRNMGGTTLCPLADAAVGPLRSLVQNFPEEVAAWIDGGGAAPPRRYFAEEVTV